MVLPRHGARWCARIVCLVALIHPNRAHAQPGNSARAPGTAFRDCAECPEMVVIPAGDFTMGSSASEKSWAVSHGAGAADVSDESPQHHVSVRSFALGKYDITRGEYAAFVRETGYPAGDGCVVDGGSRGFDGSNSMKQASASWQNPGYTQTDRDPVVCVSWQDARAYVAWLNEKVRRLVSTPVDPYRLPSESEWEYAARATATTRFWWGDDDRDAAAHSWYRANSGARTHPVGSMPANAFGLYDMAGNVWQWTGDCYSDSYADAPTDGTSREGGSNCPLRVDRGGAWFYPAWLLRPATRERNPANYRDIIMGFRVARAIPVDALDPAVTQASSRQHTQMKGDPSSRIADIENVEIGFKDGVGYDSRKLLDSVKGHYGEY
jgi:formylglycine-generating enzyme required for sulfatase activity